MCWFIRHEAGKNELSRLLAKTLRANKIAMKKFHKDMTLESTLNCSSRHSCIEINAHTQRKWCEKLGGNPG